MKKYNVIFVHVTS